MVRLSALCTGRHYPPGNIPGTHFRWRLSRPQGHSAARRIMSMKNSSDTIGNRTRDLRTCSAVPQPTAPPRTPVQRMVLWHIVKLPTITTHSVTMSHYKFYMAYNLKARKKLQWYGIWGVSPHFVQSLYWLAILTTIACCNFYDGSILQVYRHDDRFWTQISILWNLTV